MHVHRSTSGLEIFAPAKLNLFLEVLGKRADGFHEIETLMVPVGWYDTLTFTPNPVGRISLACQRTLPAGSRSHEAEELPSGDDNLVLRAVHLLRERCGTKLGADLRLFKRIPLAAGLAGGSSDAAAALAVANVGWNLDWPRKALSTLAAELGSDVPFFLAGGPAVCRGRGEQIEPVTGVGGLHFVVVRPPEGLATPAVYRACRPATEPRRVGPLLAALGSGDLGQAGRLLYNGLQPAAEGLSRWIGRLKDEFARLGCLGHQMSGSGTSYFALCQHARQAQRIAARLRSRGVGQVCAVAGCF
jgi:4-diphosphocytidyl-2-C-methyl-D-erythritol kinase